MREESGRQRELIKRKLDRKRVENGVQIEKGMIIEREYKPKLKKKLRSMCSSSHSDKRTWLNRLG